MSNHLYCRAPDPSAGLAGGFVCGLDYPCGDPTHEPYGFIDPSIDDDYEPEPPEEW